MDYYFFFYIFQRSIFNLRKTQKHLLGKNLGSPYTSNPIYLGFFWNLFDLLGIIKDQKSKKKL